MNFFVYFVLFVVFNQAFIQIEQNPYQPCPLFEPQVNCKDIINDLKCF